MKLRHLLPFLLLCIVGRASAQQGLRPVEADSLRAVWNNTAQPDSIRLEAAQKLIRHHYLFTKPDSAYYYAGLQYALAEKDSDNENMMNALNAEGISFDLRGDHAKAIAQYEQARQLAEDAQDWKGMAEALDNLGNSCQGQGDQALAIGYFNRGLKLRQEAGDRPGAARTLDHIAANYVGQGDYAQAITQYQHGMRINEEIGNKPGVAASLGRLGNVYAEKGDTVKALDYLTRSLKLKEEIGDKEGITKALKDMGGLLLAEGNTGTAISLGTRALALAQEVGADNETRDLAMLLWQSYKKADEPRKALGMYELYVAVRDSVAATEGEQEAMRQRFRIDYEKREVVLQAEQEKQDALAAEELRRKNLQRNAFIGGFALMVLLAGIFLVQRNRISKEKARSEGLLLNILPKEVAEELKEKGEAEARLIPNATVLFSDFKGFTEMSEKVSPKQLVKDLHECFSAFDGIMERHGLEKIKTIGDAYMAAGGLPVANATHAEDAVRAAFEMRDFVALGKARKITAGLPYFEIRIGIHTGPVVAGIVGVKKFQYDIWGDTVNTASRMESSGEVGRVNISEATYDLVREVKEVRDASAPLSTGGMEVPAFRFTPRGKVEAKGKGEMEMYFVEQAHP